MKHNYIGETIRYHRKLNGLTQTQLGREFALSRKAIARYESGENFPTPFIFDALVDYLGIEVFRHYLRGDWKL